MERQECSCCRFYRPRTDYGSRIGDCRRYPPEVARSHEMLGEAELAGEMRGGPLTQGVFPLVSATEWCGEFNERQ